jgi:hypothetical protein
MFSRLPRLVAVAIVANVATANAAPPAIILRLDPAQAAAVQDAMDARSAPGSPRATPDAFWEVEAQLGKALADPAAARAFEDAYSAIRQAPRAGDVR